jgi:uncharacterized protein with HEPN domain
MHEYAQRTKEYADGLTYEQFTQDKKTVDACIFNISQIGELVNFVDEQMCKAHPTIPWYALRGLRNRIVHDYEGVKIDLIWDMITLNLQELITELQAILD